MDEQTRKLVDELRAANEKRTGGEWEWGNMGDGLRNTLVAITPDAMLEVIGLTFGGENVGDLMSVSERDAAFVALCSRAVPALLAALAAAEAENAKLRAALDEINRVTDEEYLKPTNVRRLVVKIGDIVEQSLNPPAAGA